jgi:hypothetical protein
MNRLDNEYYRLNSVVDGVMNEGIKRISFANNDDEIKRICDEYVTRLLSFRQNYSDLGKAMAKEMQYHWWQFWKW